MKVYIHDSFFLKIYIGSRIQRAWGYESQFGQANESILGLEVCFFLNSFSFLPKEKESCLP